MEDPGGPEKEDRKKRSKPSGGDVGEVVYDSNEVEALADIWLHEINRVLEEERLAEEEIGEGFWEALDDGGLPKDKVNAARAEEVRFMMERKLWTLKPVTEYWEKLGRGPVSVRWVDVSKGNEKVVLVRSRLVAWDFKGGDKGRDDLFADTPPLEAKRLLLSRAATRGKCGWRKFMFIDAQKAH